MSVERVTLTYTHYSELCQNVLHFNNPDGALQSPDIALIIRDHWIGAGVGANGLINMQTNNVTWRKIEVQRLGSPPSGVYGLDIGIVGKQLNDTTSQTFIACILQFRTPFGGRAFRGRSYIGGMSTSWTSNGIVNSTFRGFADPTVSQLKAKFVSGGSQPISLLIRSRTTGGIDKVVTDIMYPLVWGVQRRRGVGYGL